jgi:hypothetical protein
VDQVESRKATGYPVFVPSAGVLAAQLLQPEMDYFSNCSWHIARGRGWLQFEHR